MPEISMRLFEKLLPAAAIFCLVASGCGDASGVGRTYPVHGQVTFNNEPVTAESTVVLFKPDVFKGNNVPFEPAGTVDEDGKYTVATRGKSGAPPGWYKVIVTATESPPEHARAPGKHRPVARSLLPAKYGQASTTDLQVEVVEAPLPGAYDLKLTK